MTSDISWRVIFQCYVLLKGNVLFQANGRSGGKSAPPSTTAITSDSFSPLSKAKLTHPKTEYEFHTTLLNAKLAELVNRTFFSLLRFRIEYVCDRTVIRCKL